jgi:flavin-dependent dehydrogenase
MRYDVAIAGGGPAGAAAALSLKRLDAGLRVAVIEASGYEAWRGGETLAPGCGQLLRSLGCWERFRAESFTESCGTSSAWGAAEAYDNEFIFSRRGNGWHVDRRRFDAMLPECAEHAGVDVFREARLTAAQRSSGGDWRLTVRTTAALSHIDARFAIDATGRAARLAVEQGAKRAVDDNLAGVFVTFRFPDGAVPADTRTLVEAQEDGWWYSSIVPGSRAVLAWMSDADLIRDRGLARHPERWHDHLALSRLTAARVTGASPETEPVTLSAQSQRLIPAAGPGWVAAGDAALSFDPLSSQGILKALQSGKIASFVAFDSLIGRAGSAERYDAAVAAQYAGYRPAKAMFYGMEQRWQGAPFWARRRNDQPA